jgi:hypothetical protein
MNDAKRAGENAESKPFNLRLPHPVAAQLDALAASLPIVSKHRLAVEALRLGIAALVADPSILLRGASTPAQTAPAAPAAPAPSRPVASPATPGVAALAAELERARALPVVLAAEDRAMPVDPRQLPLLAPASPVVALHTTADGSSVATNVGNDNGASPAASTPKPKRTRATSPAQGTDGPVIDLDALLTRHLAAIAAGRSERAITKAAGLSESTLTRWRNGHRGLTSDVAAKADAALRKLGF